MKRSRQYIKTMLMLFCVLFVVLCVYLVYIVDAYGTRWFASPYNTRVQTQKSTVTAGRIADRGGRLLAYTDGNGVRQYADSADRRRAVSHVVGDYYGQTIGAEAMFAKYLLGFDQSLSERFQDAISTDAPTGSSVVLTVDAELCETIYDLMDDYWGAVVVMNYKTGEILASVSQPTFDPEEIPAYLSGEKQLAASAMVNRVTMGRYTPGSTFKIVTLLAAKRYLVDVENRTFSCEGPLVFDLKSGRYLPNVSVGDLDAKEIANAAYDHAEKDVEDQSAETETVQKKYSIIRDSGDDYHGDLSLEQAFAHSCNTTFSKLAMELGADKLAEVARELGVGEDFLFSDMVAYSSSFQKADTERELAWSGVGQYQDLMTPLHLCLISSAIANDGTMMEPRLLYKVVSRSNIVLSTAQQKVQKVLLTPAEAQYLQGALEAVVEDGTGKKAAVSGVTVCGKTGTAEVSSDKSVASHAWFTGFIKDDEHPLAICVVLEQAGSGGSKAAPLASKIFEKAIALGY